MKSLYEKLNINKDTKVNKPVSYSFYGDKDEVNEGDQVLFACKCGDGDGILVKCIINKIVYFESNGKMTNKISRIKLQFDKNEPNWIKEDSIIKSFIDDGVPGYRITRQLLKLE